MMQRSRLPELDLSAPSISPAPPFPEPIPPEDDFALPQECTQSELSFQDDDDPELQEEELSDDNGEGSAWLTRPVSEGDRHRGRLVHVMHGLLSHARKLDLHASAAAGAGAGAFDGIREHVRNGSYATLAQFASDMADVTMSALLEAPPGSAQSCVAARVCDALVRALMRHAHGMPRELLGAIDPIGLPHLSCHHCPARPRIPRSLHRAVCAPL